MYDYAHPISDAIEGITHSICTLEFEDHRPLYDWILDHLPVPCHPQQIEFARLNLSYTVMSKRKLLKLVNEGHVAGWDDPRMPTLAGMRRRGYTPEAIRNFAERIGVAKRENLVDLALLEYCVREDLNRRAPRVMGVLRPLKVVIENYPEGQVEELEAVNNPEDPAAGTRKVPFSRELYIEREDFMEEPPKKFYRLAPGREVRLRYAYYIKCVEVVKDAAGRGGGAALHLRPGDQGRLRPGRPQGEGHPALGLGGPRRAGRGAPLRPALHPARARRRPRRRFHGGPQPRFPGGAEVLPPGTRPGHTPRPGSFYQFERQGYFCADLRIRPPAPRSSTAPSP